MNGLMYLTDSYINPLNFDTSEIMKLAVEKSNFGGLFVRLTKNNRYIRFSSSAWFRLQEQIGSITDAMNNGKLVGYRLTEDCFVETERFHRQMYVCFKQRCKFTSTRFYINMDGEQWEDFRQRTLDISPLENIPPEPTITRYLYISERYPPKSFFTKAALEEYAEVQGYAPYWIIEKKVQAPDKDRLTQLVRAYMTKKKLKDLVRQNCYGCRHNMSSPMDHMCLEQDSEDAFRHLVNLTDVTENVFKIARALNLKPELYKPEEDNTWPVTETIPEDYQDFFEKTLSKFLF